MNNHKLDRDDDKRITLSSGNVFKDLGFKNPEEMVLKAQLVREISSAIKEKGLTLQQSSEVLDLKIQEVSDLLKGRFSEYSIEHLFKYMNALDRDLEIIVKPCLGEKVGVRVTVLSA